MIKQYNYRKYTFLCLLFISIASPLYASNKFIHHDLTVKIDPAKHYITVQDDVIIPADKLKSEIHFLLYGGLAVVSKTKNVDIQADKGDLNEIISNYPKDLKLPTDLPIKSYSLHLPKNHKASLKLSLQYSGNIHHPVKQLNKEYGRGMSETPGIISPKGVYLGGSTFWVPWFDHDLVTFTITSTIPESWTVVSQGERTVNEKKNNKKTIRWDSPNPVDEIFWIGAKFIEYINNDTNVATMAFLRTPDENLANKYLETTAQYLKMYQDLIGPFPYKKFALVENFWETGYGMPSFTLLGPRIIRFPFILHSSYPHELLHNWWGNSVFVKPDTGNWCEGLTAFLADHLIKEQRGLGVEHRRTALKEYADYVNEGNEFPLSTFKDRTNASSSAIGYEKSMMIWNMLRLDVGDELFVKAIQKFYKDKKFQYASFDDIQKSFEAVTHKDLNSFFRQWVNRKGAPRLQLSEVKTEKMANQFHLTFKLAQTQSGEPYTLNIPVAIYLEGQKEAQLKKIKMVQQNQNYEFFFPSRPLRINVDPQYDLFRQIDPNETPPSLSQAFGAKKILIILPSKTDTDKLKGYRKLAETWAKEEPDKIKISMDKDISQIPNDRAVWLLGWENSHIKVMNKGIFNYNAEIGKAYVRFNKTTLKRQNNSFVISMANPQQSDSVIVWLTSQKIEALSGLARKIPHYGKYSYLAFEGDEPSNIFKGQWPVVNSPMISTVKQMDGVKAVMEEASLPQRYALAELPPVFSEKKLMNHVKVLASEEMEGRGIGSQGLDKAAQYIAHQFKKLGLQPGGDNGEYFQTWQDKGGIKEQEVTMKNVIAIIPGKRDDWNNQSVVISAHYDHLGFGWPNVHQGDEGKIHFGADDNASGVAVMLELGHYLSKNQKPARAIIFVAFTGEESDQRGSKYYIKHIKRYPAKNIMGVLNLDTVGRLGKNKLLIIGGSSAREWKHIFMGSGYVTGVESQLVTEDLDSSDHVSFINNNIPAVQIFSGGHNDYHRPGDTIDRIDSGGMVKVANFVLEAVVYLSEREEPLTMGKKKTSSSNYSSKTETRKVKVGTIPDFSYSGKGVLIAQVMKDTPAMKAGLQKGDLIVKFGENKIESLREYSNVLKKYKPNDKVIITYIRDGKEVLANVVLTAR